MFGREPYRSREASIETDGRFPSCGRKLRPVDGVAGIVARTRHVPRLEPIVERLAENGRDELRDFEIVVLVIRDNVVRLPGLAAVEKMRDGTRDASRMEPCPATDSAVGSDVDADLFVVEDCPDDFLDVL